ncbi:phosphatase PAP2 family protein [Neobacillus sp. 179-J 1A1 HS]|uniref:phosphatase PAP2 family protein n=1 Tax=Neobacillus driksii TaxID=3035913 RepID=UPI0035BC2762
MKKTLLFSSFICLILVIVGCNKENLKEVNKKEAIPGEEQGLGWKHDNPAAPTAGEWKPINFPDGSKYSLETPPANDSDITKKDLEELRQLAENRTEEDIKIINRWAGEITGPNTRWAAVTEEILKKYTLAPPEAAKVHHIVSGTIYTASVAAFHEKYRYLRPRPTHLDPNLQLIENFSVPAHPAYPSAHATTGWAACTILSYIFPDEKETFIAMVNESDLSRKLAGVHFESDNIAGRKLGKQIAEDIIEGLKDVQAPLYYEEHQQSAGGTGH